MELRSADRALQNTGAVTCLLNARFQFFAHDVIFWYTESAQLYEIFRFSLHYFEFTKACSKPSVLLISSIATHSEERQNFRRMAPRRRLAAPLEMHGKRILFLKDLYTANKVIARKESHATEKAAIRRVLCQGCPLSPPLFMIYLRRLEGSLEQSGLGFDLSFLESGIPAVQSLSSLMYAADVVLFVNS